MQFSDLLKRVDRHDACITLSDHWAQGRASFGGLVAALVYQSMCQKRLDKRPVRALQISFVGPVAPGELSLQSEIMRSGKSVTHIMGKGYQNGEVVISVLGSFGDERDSAMSVVPEPRKRDWSLEDTQKLPYIEGIAPRFTQHFDFRFRSALPFTNSSDTQVQGAVRYQEQNGDMNEALMLGLIDAWPPATLPLLASPGPSSSLNWTIEFVQPMPHLKADEFTFYHADLLLAKGGYGHIRAEISNQQGDLIALSQQTVVYFYPSTGPGKPKHLTKAWS